MAAARPMNQNSARKSRSEEYTSELQSHHDLVCRLLLEKKKKKQTQQHNTKKKKQNPGNRSTNKTHIPTRHSKRKTADSQKIQLEHLHTHTTRHSQHQRQ